jgi:hypothetical protein
MYVCRTLGGIQLVSGYKLQKIITESWHKFRAFIFQKSGAWIQMIRDSQYFMIAKEHKKKSPDIRLIISEMRQH